MKQAALILAFSLALSACSTTPQTPITPLLPLEYPDRIEVRYLVWGRADTWWSITRDGEGRHFADGVEHTFHTPAEAFDRIREIMRPWERDSISCSNAPTDGPYGEITFAAGEERRRSGWRLGCASATSEDLYRRLDDADNAIHDLMGVEAPD